ncbi:hypothetical protein D3C78_1167380 [compost metagenome]
MLVDTGRCFRHCEQARGAVLSQRDKLCPGCHQRVVLHASRQFGLQAINHRAGGGGRIQTVLQPGKTHIGDGRHEDQHFGDHHENDREQQQPSGKTGGQSRHAVHRIVLRAVQAVYAFRKHRAMILYARRCLRGTARFICSDDNRT